MPKNSKINRAHDGRVTIVKNMQSHANDPFVLKKVAEAKAILNRVKFPEDLKK